jgi:hypothetical protein
LLHVSREHSKEITDRINVGDKSEKPGWVRISLHPTTTNAEAQRIVEAITALAAQHREWAADYTYNPHTNEFMHRVETGAIARRVQHWFDEFGRSAVVASEWEPMGLGFEI